METNMYTRVHAYIRMYIRIYVRVLSFPKYMATIAMRLLENDGIRYASIKQDRIKFALSLKYGKAECTQRDGKRYTRWRKIYPHGFRAAGRLRCEKQSVWNNSNGREAERWGGGEREIGVRRANMRVAICTHARNPNASFSG